MTAKVSKEAILPWKGLWQDLLVLSPNLSFTQSVTERALVEVAQRKGWFRKVPNHLQNFKVDVASRMRVMSRQLQQGRGKSVLWIHDFLGLAPPKSVDVSSGSTEDAEENGEANEDKDLDDQPAIADAKQDAEDSEEEPAVAETQLDGAEEEACQPRPSCKPSMVKDPAAADTQCKCMN